MHNVQFNQLLFLGHQARVVSNDWTVGHRTGLFCLLSPQWLAPPKVMNDGCEICIKSDCQWNLRATKSTTSAKRNFFISSASLWSCWRWWKWKWFSNICHCYYSESDFATFVIVMRVVILQHFSLLWKWKCFSKFCHCYESESYVYCSTGCKPYLARYLEAEGCHPLWAAGTEWWWWGDDHYQPWRWDDDHHQQHPESQLIW